MRPEAESENRYLVKYYRPAERSPNKRRKYRYTAVPVTEEIGEKAAMALAEQLWAEHEIEIKAVSAEYQTGIVIRTFQQHH
jgi:hypothetical protein